MESMFEGCSGLEKIKLSTFGSENIMEMSNLFNGCTNLKSIEFVNFDTHNVTAMDEMFKECRSLEKIDVSAFVTDKVTSMESIFMGCSGLKNLDLKSFNSSNVINMNAMFTRCKSLQNLDISSFDMRNVEYIFSFSGCENLQSINMPKALKEEVFLPSTPGYIWLDSNGTMCTAVTQNLTTSMKYSKTTCIDIANAIVGAIPVQEYTGKAVTPLPVVTYQNAKLVLGRDFVVSYAENINPGTASIEIKGIGRYKGSKTVTFAISVNSLEKAVLGTLEYKYKKGNLGKLSSKTFYSLYLDFEPVAYATEYEIELSNNKGKKVKTVKVKCAGKTYVEKTIKNLNGNLYGVRMRALIGNGKGPWSDKAYVIKQPRSQARSYKGNVQVKWEKISGATGYNIYMSTLKNGTYKKVASAGKNKSLITIKKYNKKKLQTKTYYYYVVAKKKVGKKTYKSSRNFVYIVKNKA